MEEKYNKLSSVFGNALLSKAPKVTISGYEKIKKRILKKEGINHPVYECVEQEQPVIVFFVSCQLEQKCLSYLDNAGIQYITFRNFQKTSFIINEKDKDEVMELLGSLNYDLRQPNEIHSYEGFMEYVAKNDLYSFFIKNLDECQAEFIRREFSDNASNCHYTFFKINDDKWCLGFTSNNLITHPESGETDRSLLEIFLYACIALNGVNSHAHITLIKEDTAADRLFPSGFAPSLIKRDMIYVVDPTCPYFVIKITKDGFSLPDVRFDEEYPVIKDTPLIKIDTLIGSYQYKYAFYKMKHKKILYSTRDLIALITSWKENKASNAVQEAHTQSEKELAAYIYKVFAFNNSKKNWFNAPAKKFEQIKQFKNELNNIYDAFSDETIPFGYSEKEAENLLNLFNNLNMSAEEFGVVVKSFNNLDIDNIKEKINDTPLSEILFSLDKSATEIDTGLNHSQAY